MEIGKYLFFLCVIVACSAQIPDFIDNTENVQRKLANSITTAIGWETNALAQYFNQQKLPLTYATDVESDLKQTWSNLEFQYQTLVKTRADFITQNPQARVKCLDQLLYDGQTYLQRMGIRVGSAYKNVMDPLNSQIDFLFSNLNSIWNILNKENAYSDEDQYIILQRLNQLVEVEPSTMIAEYSEKLNVQRENTQKFYNAILNDMQRRVVDIIGDFNYCL
jgi:hypothetical protein